MGVQDLQLMLETGQMDGSVIDADLIRIARNKVAQSNAALKSKVNQRKVPVSNKLSLVMDAECCLNRLYGGYFSDWVCGGQWNRVASFLTQFVHSLDINNIEVIVFFNGCSEAARHDEWVQQQLKHKFNINQVLKHIANKGTPPPKIWWTPPTCLRSVLRMALRNLNVQVVVTMDDHRQEVIGYCRENQCDGIIADDPEYIAFDPPRYFSAQSLKLTYKGSLQTKEYIVSALSKGLQLDNDEMCVLVALLGNYLLPESQLFDLHSKLSPYNTKDRTKEKDEDKRLEYACHLVKSVATFIKSLTHTAKELDQLGLEVFGTAGTERAAKLKQAVQYYLNGTNTHFFNYSLTNSGAKSKKVVKPGVDSDINLDTTKLASEHVNELESLVSLTEAQACLNVGPDSEHDATNTNSNSSDKGVNGDVSNGNSVLVITAGSSTSSGSPRVDPAKSNKSLKQVRLVVEDDKASLPEVSAEVLRTVNERHIKGLMTPMIYQILTQGEVRLGVVMEEEGEEEIPNIQLFYRPMRQMVYAILFNLHHHVYLARTQSRENKGEYKMPQVRIKEWIWTKNNPYLKPDHVRAEQLGWGVPTVQRLWFGTTVDDKRRRLRAYLTCMRSDTQLMLDSSYVPQHLLILASVLRFIMSATEKRVLRKYELDAIIATALDPHLANAEYNQELKLDCVTSRSVQVGSLIMSGIEHALLVNDTCGAPIPWVVACPWLYFDGKLVHSTMARAATVKNALELCNHRLPQVMKVERMREAILEGLIVQWARPPVASNMSSGNVVPSGGGRLEIAGVVVGNWGPNCRLPHDSVPQVTSVGVGRGRGYLRGSNRRHNNVTVSVGKRGTSSSGSRSSGGNRRRGSSNTSAPRGRGRGVTAVSPFTGEVVEAQSLVSDQLDDSVSEPPSKPLTILNHHNQSVFMNGGNTSESSQQFEDTQLAKDMKSIQLNGEVDSA